MLYLHARATNTNSLVILNELQILERKKACHCNYPPMNLAMTNNRMIKSFLAIQPQQTLRAVFLFIDQLLLTTESNYIDISHMSTPAGTIGTYYRKVYDRIDRKESSTK